MQFFSANREQMYTRSALASFECETVDLSSLLKARFLTYRQFFKCRLNQNRVKITLRPWHIKVRMMKQFFKALDKEGYCFKYICRKCPQLIKKTSKGGVFNDPQTRQLMKDADFIKVILIRKVSFIGHCKASNYKEIVQNTLTTFRF